MKIEIVKVKEEELNDVRKLWIDFSGMEDDELSVEGRAGAASGAVLEWPYQSSSLI